MIYLGRNLNWNPVERYPNLPTQSLIDESSQLNFQSFNTLSIDRKRTKTTMEQIKNDVDVLIIGGGTAGTIAATVRPPWSTDCFD